MAEQNLEKWGIALVDRVDSAIDATMESIAEDGQQMLQDMIQTRGLGTTWKRVRYKRGVRREGSKNGRVWTGDMLNDIEKDSGRRAPWVAFASFGWIRNFKEYYGQQDVGFTHPDTKEHIEGMFIMRDTEDLIMNIAARQLDKELYRV